MNPPSFFKVFIPEICDKDMEIPSPFTLGLKQSLPEKVLLKDRHGNGWTVTVARIGERCRFLDGWVKFTLENYLTGGDILVFEYYCHNCFYVLVFGTASTEKNIVPFMVPKRDRVSYADNLSESDDYAPPMETGSDGETGGYDCEDDGDDDDDDDDGDDLALQQVNVDAGGSRNANQINEKRDCYGKDIFLAGLAPQPRNPYFVTKVMQKRKGDLFIPMDVIKDFDLELAKEIKLVDPNSREFRGKCRTWKDGRVVISGGWRSLCRMNLVIEDDKCICEFVQGGKNEPLFLKVSFVRAT